MWIVELTKWDVAPREHNVFAGYTGSVSIVSRMWMRDSVLFLYYDERAFTETTSNMKKYINKHDNKYVQCTRNSKANDMAEFPITKTQYEPADEKSSEKN